MPGGGVRFYHDYLIRRRAGSVGRTAAPRHLRGRRDPAIAEKDFTLAPVYDPRDVEEKWYRFWEERGYFTPRADGTPPAGGVARADGAGERQGVPGAEPEAGGAAAGEDEAGRARRTYCIVIPPPNVTGSLHLGHALNNTLQDILIRWRRMQGYATLWLPGTDHAGIATQAVVEKDLAREGLTRQELGRERFLERVWQWKEHYERRIIGQLKRLGASCDWTRTRFTMDPGLSRAVEEVFVRYHEKGLIYRGDYMVNWCPRCGTAISDLEVNHEPQAGRLWHILYPFVEGPLPDGRAGVVVATTRPETMLGDTAVAVHPADGPYRDLVGRRVRLPLVGREIPIVADEFVDPEFGTGAVKVTPAHDPNDFEMGRRHGLPSVRVIGFDGRMTEEAGSRYAGLDRYEARERVVADLEGEGRLLRVEEHEHAVGRCDRCNSVVEPLVSRQWFVRMKPLAAPAIAAVRDGRVRFVPERFARVYEHWLENVRDWCISRQLWWGHRIPAWHCPDCGETTVAREREAPRTCPRCGSARLERDPDVLDTWFSSALWPFSTLGWPEETEDMRRFYPTDVLVTGYDIIFFWVARMVWSSLEFTGREPFRHVYVHGIVRDSLGRKMSKSLGNGVDPLEVIEKYGADTLRFTLITGVTPGNDQRWHWERVEGSRNFCNKVWNAARFVLAQLDGFTPPAGGAADRTAGSGDAGSPGAAPTAEPLAVPPGAELPERWIISRANGLVAEVTDLLERFELGEAARLLYDFFWGEFCDWYLELAKPRLSGPGRDGVRRTLWSVLETWLRLAHPFLPFITEEIWQRLPHRGESLAVAPWPAAGPRDEEAEGDMGFLMEVTRAVRNLRAEMRIAPAARAVVRARAEGRERRLLTVGAPLVQQLAGLAELRLDPDGDAPGKAVTAVVGGTVLSLPLEDLVDVERELARLERELAAAREELRRVEAKLGDPRFRERAPAEVVAKEEAKRQDLALRAARLSHRVSELTPPTRA